MKAYLGRPQLKADFLDQLRWHVEQDRLIKGTYGDTVDGEWRGCAVGCSIHSLAKLRGAKLNTADHKLYESMLGIPAWLAWLEDSLFEGLPDVEAKFWPIRFAEAINVGADLEPVKWRFLSYLIRDNLDRVLGLDLPDDLRGPVAAAIRQVLAVHEAAVETGVWDEVAAEFAAKAASRASEFAGASVWEARSALLYDRAVSLSLCSWLAESARNSVQPFIRSVESATRASGYSIERATLFAFDRFTAVELAYAAWSTAEMERNGAYVQHSETLLQLLGQQ